MLYSRACCAFRRRLTILELIPGGVAAAYGDVFPASAQLDAAAVFGEQDEDCIAAAAIAADEFMEQYDEFVMPPYGLDDHGR